MQFIKNGPDIPERLLQIHEEGRVVFFCGAGISYPAGLPGFDGLVRLLYERLGVTPDPVQQAALRDIRYDTAISLLEDRHVGGRRVVRRELAAILTPTEVSHEATRTHEALLTLSQRRDGKLRLVTTNFDRLFQAVIERESKAHSRHLSGPTLAGAQEPLGRLGLSAWVIAARSKRQRTGLPGGVEWRFRPGLSHRALGSAFRQRVVPTLHRVLRGVQPQRPCAALHDGRSGGGSPTRRGPTHDVCLWQLHKRQGDR